MGLNPETLAGLKGLRKNATTVGFQIGTGFNFYNLEPQAKLLYSVHHPLLNSISRVGSRGGDSVHWKGLTGFDTVNGAGYPMSSEGNRVAVFDVTEKDYVTKYKFLGKENNVTFQSQLAGKSFDDILGLANITRLQALLQQEDRMMLWGNPGTAGIDTGFQLGTAGTPTLALVAGSGFTTGATVTVAVVALTGYGYQAASLSGGVLTSFTRTNADGSSDTIYGGSSAISSLSSTITTTSGNNQVKATVAATKGAVAYAWYVSTAGSPALSTSYLAAITTVPTATFTAAASSSNQAGNATGLSTDNSANPMDFTGLITWTVAGGGYWNDLGGAGLTANGDGTILEFENLLQYLWNVYKIGPDSIILGGTLQRTVSRAILGNGATGQSQRLVFDTDQAGRLTGGTLATQYRNPYVSGNGGGKSVIDIWTHPWLPDGTIMFDLSTNPYPDSKVGNVREFETMQDHFSMVWPYRSLKYEMGTYCFGALKHYIPFGTGLMTGVGHFVNIPGGSTVPA